MKRFSGLLLVLLLASSAGASFAVEDLSISKAVALALEYSPYVKAMTAGSHAARAKIGEAQAMRRAKIAVGVSESTTDSPMMAFGSKLNQQRITAADFDPAKLNDPDYTNNLQAGLQVVQPLYLGGMDRHAVAAARQGLQAQELDQEQAVQDVIFRTIEAYLNVILARESVSVAEKAVEASKESLRNTSAAFEANQAVQSDVLQAQVHHSQNEETLLRMQNQYRLAREGLATVLGIASVDEYHLNMPFLQQECQTCKQEPSDLIKEALAERADYRKLSKQIVAAGHMEKMARGSVRPQVAIGTRFEHNSRDGTRDGHGNALFFARMDWNIGDGGEARHKAQGAKWQANQLTDLMKAKEDQIRLEIREAVTNINNALERIRVSQDAIQHSEESLRILRDRYVAGLAIVSELLGAETSLLSHKMNHLKALYDYSISRARLKLALGDLTVEKCEILHPETPSVDLGSTSK